MFFYLINIEEYFHLPSTGRSKVTFSPAVEAWALNSGLPDNSNTLLTIFLCQVNVSTVGVDVSVPLSSLVCLFGAKLDTSKVCCFKEYQVKSVLFTWC